MPRNHTRRPHPYDDIDALGSAYEKALYCLAKAEGYRRKWFEDKNDAADGEMHVIGQAHSNSDSFSREFDWKKSPAAQDLVGLEQMYSRWADVYFNQYRTELALDAYHARNSAELVGVE